MEKLRNTRRRRGIAAGCVLAGVLLAGCSSEAPDYTGAGNEFVVRGVVSDAEEDGLIQVYEADLTVIAATGKAATWFAEGKGQESFSDEFDFLARFDAEPGGWISCGTEQYVGQVVGASDEQLRPEQLLPGDVVEITGSLRDHSYYQSTGKSGYCTHQKIAVYTVTRVIDGPIGPVS